MLDYYLSYSEGGFRGGAVDVGILRVPAPRRVIKSAGN